MTQNMDADEARNELYAVMRSDDAFEAKAEAALAIGEAFLDVDNGHMTKIDPETNYWRAIASTDPPDGSFPPGQVLNLSTTYCRRTVAQSDPVALHDVPAQGWEDDPAFEEHGLHCYHGTTVAVDDDIYGTVCFVSESPRQRPFDEAETMFAELVAHLLEHELRRERTDRKLERLETFAEVLSHDIRNPLNVAIGRVDVARGEDDENLRVAADALDRIDSLVTDVLQMARHGTTVEETTVVELSAVAEHSWEMVDTPTATLAVEGDLSFRASRDRLHRLFENCFRNAVEHGAAETVSVGALADEPGFFVADDGSGIPDDQREAVFAPGHSSDEEGLGLGLAIVESVVTDHEWTIEVTESRDGGARFEVSGVVVVDP